VKAVRNTWKNNERVIAKKLNTKRTPLSGSNSGHTSSDTLSPKFYVEAKHRLRIPFYKTFMDTKEKARKEKKIPIVVFHQKGSHTRIVMMDFDTFAELIKEEK